LDLEEVRASGGAGLSVSAGNEIIAFETFEEDSIPVSRRVKVPRTSILLNLYSPPGCLLEGGGMSIPFGEQCPEVWMDSAEIEADGESVYYKMELHKNYCLITVRLFSSDGSLAYPYKFEISGGICGYLPEGDPESGGFRSLMEAVDGAASEYSCRVPRQVDNSLMLSILSGDKILRSFALGEYLSEAGYDWDGDDLEDTYIEIDFARTRITVTIGGWQESCRHEIVI